MLSRLGEGGFGKVYLAEHVKIGRRSAVKVLNQDLRRDPGAISRFIREASNASHIAHPNVAAIYDFGETSDGLLYIAMEYVEGDPLSRIVQREGALPISDAVEIARQIAEALGAAHELGIVHRDLKPDNVLVRSAKDGGYRIKLVDFGISKSTHGGQEGLTRTGFAIGTPDYMSPEQLIDDPVDARSDIYSLGCILYQLLVGEQAFSGPSLESLITRRLLEDPPHPRVRNPKVPRALDEVVVKALAKTPDRRFQSAGELCVALHSASQPSRRVLQLSSWAWPGRSDRSTGAGGEEVREGDSAGSPREFSSSSPSVSPRSTSLLAGRVPTGWRRGAFVAAALAIGATFVLVVVLTGRDTAVDEPLAMPTSPAPQAPADSTGAGRGPERSLAFGPDQLPPPAGDTPETETPRGVVQDASGGPSSAPSAGGNGENVRRTDNPEQLPTSGGTQIPAEVAPPSDPSPTTSLLDRSQASAAELARIAQTVAVARVERDRGEFVAATRRLREAESHLLPLAGSEPAALLEQVREEILNVQRACASLGVVLRQRSETPPPCS